MKKNEIVLFEAKDGKVTLPVQLDAETVWLTRMQMAELFEKDRTVILRHIQNAIKEGEIDPKVTCAKFAQVTPHGAIPGKTRTQIVDLYNLDVIISVGYISDQALYESIKGENVRLLGDADHPGNLMSAIWGAYTTALNI